MADNISLDEANALVGSISMTHTSPDSKWLSQVPYDHRLLDLSIESGDVKYVVQSLNKVSVHWYAIGVSLGVPVEKLEEIETDCKGTPRQLVQMIICWINNCECHTWKALIEVLYQLGYRTAVSAAIRNAGLAMTKYASTTEEFITTKNWSKEAKRRSLRKEQVASTEVRVDRRERELLEKLGQILCIPSSSSRDCLLDNINQCIIGNPYLTHDQLKQVVFIVGLLTEEYHKHSSTLQTWAEELKKDVKNISTIRAQLTSRKVELKEYLFKLNQEMKDIKTEKEYSKGEVQHLLQMLAEYEGNIQAVKHQIEHCIKELHYANCDFQSLSDTLSTCINQLELAKRKNEKMEVILASCIGYYDKCLWSLLVVTFTVYISSLGFTINLKYGIAAAVGLAYVAATTLLAYVLSFIHRPKISTTILEIHLGTNPVRIFTYLTGTITGIIALIFSGGWIFLFLGISWASSVILSGLVLYKYNGLVIGGLYKSVVTSILGGFTSIASFEHFKSLKNSYLKSDEIITLLFMEMFMVVSSCVAVITIKKLTTRYGVVMAIGFPLGIMIAESRVRFYNAFTFLNAFLYLSASIYIMTDLLESNIIALSSTPENNILNKSRDILSGNVEVLISTTKDIKATQFQLLHTEHPYSH